MSQARKRDQELLTKDELELTEAARQPALSEMEHDKLVDLAKRLRERRNRSRDLVRSQRRNRKGRGEGTPPAGESRGERKKDLLAAAMKRVNKELDRRRSMARQDQAGLARKALRRKQQAERPPIPTYRNARKGMRPSPNSKIAPSGALSAEGQRPVLERSRKVR
ncbi:MAG: hypothetical protein ACK4E3_02880 [Brevundimonas sp.]|jgi:hypothetical protein|uniref:hypothetical protein n=1 Tax=Brevundimonas sp. TaxID=1871086 RepID=UPI003918EE49